METTTNTVVAAPAGHGMVHWCACTGMVMGVGYTGGGYDDTGRRVPIRAWCVACGHRVSMLATVRASRAAARHMLATTGFEPTNFHWSPDIRPGVHVWHAVHRANGWTMAVEVAEYGDASWRVMRMVML